MTAVKMRAVSSPLEWQRFLPFPGEPYGEEPSWVPPLARDEQERVGFRRHPFLARAVTDHATPVGSGTVARTKRIPVEQRAEAAVIAWMRHQTTGYDGVTIPRVKRKRREVRRLLAHV